MITVRLPKKLVSTKAQLNGVMSANRADAKIPYKIILNWNTKFMLPSSSPGAFIILGFFLAIMNWIAIRKAAKSGKVYEVPAGFDCKHCNLCDLSSTLNSDD